MGSKYSLGEIVGGAVLLLGVAVFVNSTFDLGVEFLYEIEETITGGGASEVAEDFSIDYDSASKHCQKMIKVYGETKRVIRKHIREAEDEDNQAEVDRLRADLEGRSIRIKDECG